MKRKWLVIGINTVSVILLILTSLSNVVGYQTVKSTVNDSPLFQTRTQRATNQQQNLLTSQYIGMDRGNPLQFPLRDNRTEQLKKVIDIISKMDDTTFTQFTELCIQKARQDDTLRGICRFQITQVLHLLKINPDAIMNFITEKDNLNMTSGYLTCDIPIVCLGFLLLWPIWSLIWFIFVELPGLLFPTHAYSCRSYCICQH